MLHKIMSGSKGRCRGARCSGFPGSFVQEFWSCCRPHCVGAVLNALDSIAISPFSNSGARATIVRSAHVEVKWGVVVGLLLR